MAENNITATREGLIAEIKRRVDDKILEQTNAELLTKLIRKADTLDEAMAIAQLGTTYKRTGLHYDKRLEKQRGNTIKYFKKNEQLSFTDGSDSTHHKLIIGDNYDALLNLLIDYRGMVDVIYIDPPYGKDKMGEFANTNYDNAITRDNLLSMLQPRLVLAKQLLSDNGVILCSIDDKNFAYIKCLFDEVFEEKNFLANFVWHSEGHTDNQDPITCVHEYIICYAKKESVNKVVDPNVNSDSKILRDFAENSITKNGIKNPPLIITLPKGFPCEVESLYRPNFADYSSFKDEVDSRGFISRAISTKYKVQYPLCIDSMTAQNYQLANECRVFSGFTSPSKLRKFIENNCEPIDDNGTTLKYYLSKNGVIYYRREGRESHYLQTLLENMGTTEKNKYMLEDIGVIFEYPKPVELIKFLLTIFSNENSTILDFFAGSGSTGHAILELNKDGGHREFILCQSIEREKDNPNGIAYDVTSKRLKRIMTGSCYDGTSDFKWVKDNEPFGGSLDVYEIESVSNAEHVCGKTPFDVIDETLYGKEKFDNLEDKIRWVCENFEVTQDKLVEKK